MAPSSTIYLTRHAQAEHNVDEDYSILDAPLTPLGKKQTAAVAPQIPELQEKVDLIVTSGLKRTLQTTLGLWRPAVDRLGLENVVVLPEAQECNNLPCDTGSPRAELENNPEFTGLNFSRLGDDWTSKRNFWAADPESIRLRARAVRQFLRERPEKEIAVVAHGDILRQITASADGPSSYMWKNAEIRVFTFNQNSVETEDCFLTFERAVEGAKGYTRFSSDADFPPEANGKL